jgi:hypothetical protein
LKSHLSGWFFVNDYLPKSAFNLIFRKNIIYAMTIDLSIELHYKKFRFDDDEFYDFCTQNDDLRFERDLPNFELELDFLLN